RRDTRVSRDWSSDVCSSDLRRAGRCSAGRLVVADQCGAQMPDVLLHQGPDEVELAGEVVHQSAAADAGLADDGLDGDGAWAVTTCYSLSGFDHRGAAGGPATVTCTTHQQTIPYVRFSKLASSGAAPVAFWRVFTLSGTGKRGKPSRSGMRSGACVAAGREFVHNGGDHRSDHGRFRGRRGRRPSNRTGGS